MRAVKELAELGFIEKKQRGRGPHGSQSNDYNVLSISQVSARRPSKRALKALSAKTDNAPLGVSCEMYTKVLPYIPATTASVDGGAIAPADPDRPAGGASPIETPPNEKRAAVAAYPDKVLTNPALNPDKLNEIQPAFSLFFEFERQFAPEEGSIPLWQGDNLTQPDEPPHPVQQDRIQKKKNVPPRPRKVDRAAQNYAYTYDAAGWLQLPAVNGQNSQARAIAVRAMQELILQDYGGPDGLQAEWEQDDDGLWRVVDHKGDDGLAMGEMLDKDGRLPLKALRNYAVTFAGLSQGTFNENLQSLYEIALDHRAKGGRLVRLDEGDRWIDQPLFEDYLGGWLEDCT